MLEEALLVGDTHAKLNELDDCRALIDQIVEIVTVYKIQHVIFMGDQFNDHSVVNVDVLNFWRESFSRLESLKRSVIALVGNHDVSPSSGKNAMVSCADLILLIDRPTVHQGILMLPYIKSNDELERIAKEHSRISTLIGHLTTQGAQYENGFYAKDGIDDSKFPQSWIISGHIHVPGQIGKTLYTGSSRWLTANDANSDKLLFHVKFDHGKPIVKQTFKSECRQKLLLVDSESKPIQSASQHWHEHDTTMVIEGSKSWINGRLDLWRDKFKVRTSVIEEAKTVVVAESKGIDLSFADWCKGFDGVAPKDRLASLVKERLNVEF